ncbi:hypothetical protein NJT12_10525 [Flavobacterium sp. AC]|uniref:DUF3857 domain-containing protein n=1 Tax=Flavobacterium azizsancarii TaxID=2961580 RepID=A0ABT4WCU5_9FLAO|nr:hypothetical protein [Flavobacterium azizsancarii]MDA6070052.1 hypothetical protein [Flavobacterium azizsancarii]
MKLFLLYLSFLQCICATAQSDAQYHAYTNSIKQFSKPVRILSNYINKEGNGPIEFTNAKKQILRFRVMNQKLQIQHGGVVYQLFYYKNDYLQRIETFDINGNLAGERESKNEAGITFIIEKPALYLKKKKLIDAEEGNIDLKDDTSEKIIRVELFDHNNLPIREFQPTYISSKMYWNYNVRMYWP